MLVDKAQPHVQLHYMVAEMVEEEYMPMFYHLVTENLVLVVELQI